MRIWVDADACPLAIKEIIFKAAKRTGIETILVANQALRIPKSEFIKQIVVQSGFDKADQKIVQELQAHDLVITADIPLADQVIEKDCIALNPRGELYTKDNIKQRLLIRNYNDTLRSTGIHTGGPNQLASKEIQAFANHLDKLLTAVKKKN